MSNSMDVVHFAFDVLILIIVTLMFGWLSELERKITVVTKPRGEEE